MTAPAKRTLTVASWLAGWLIVCGGLALSPAPWAGLVVLGGGLLAMPGLGPLWAVLRDGLAVNSPGEWFTTKGTDA